MTDALPPLTIVALVCAAIAVLLLGSFLTIRPAITRVTKIWLLFALGVFPLGVAFSGNVQGFEATKKRSFCGSCHVMSRHASDSNDPHSGSLASRHGRNALFGDENCYACHADYGMYGTVVTKMGGMRHVWLYYTEYADVPLDDALKTIHTVKPYANATCMHCHSTEVDLWEKVPDHASSLADVRSGKISCASAGCHGYAHPFTKSDAATAQGVHGNASGARPDGGTP